MHALSRCTTPLHHSAEPGRGAGSAPRHSEVVGEDPVGDPLLFAVEDVEVTLEALGRNIGSGSAVLGAVGGTGQRVWWVSGAVRTLDQRAGGDEIWERTLFGSEVENYAQAAERSCRA